MVFYSRPLVRAPASYLVVSIWRTFVSFVLIVSTILESHSFQAMSLEEGIKHSTSARDASRLDERLRRIIKFSLANHVSVRTAT